MNGSVSWMELLRWIFCEVEVKWRPHQIANDENRNIAEEKYRYLVKMYSEEGWNTSEVGSAAFQLC